MFWIKASIKCREEGILKSAAKKNAISSKKQLKVLGQKKKTGLPLRPQFKDRV
jgi:hypothetical protein